MIYYNSEHCTIKYFEKEKLIFSQYHGFAPSEELRNMLDAMFKLISTNDVGLSLSDRRKMKVIRPADQDYISNIWLPQLLRLSKIKKFATIESEDVFNKVSVENILKKLEGEMPFEIHVFNSLDDACSWLNIDCKILET